jgi:hypothetical protein
LLADLPAEIVLREVAHGTACRTSHGPDRWQVELINALSRTGVPRIEGSRSSTRDPANADADEVAGSNAIGVRYSASCPTYAPSALAASSRRSRWSSPPPTPTTAEINRSTAESLAGLTDIVTTVHGAGATLS